jgi:hypothetical protein
MKIRSPMAKTVKLCRETVMTPIINFSLMKSPNDEIMFDFQISASHTSNVSKIPPNRRSIVYCFI